MAGGASALVLGGVMAFAAREEPGIRKTSLASDIRVSPPVSEVE